MNSNTINRGEPALIHPTTGAYVLLDDNGNIRIGLQDFGDALVVARNGELYINSSRVHFITDDITWKELEFNEAAVNPSQPALMPREGRILEKELARYD